MRRLAQPQAIRTVFFDVGFTLLAPHPSLSEIVEAVCVRRGTPVQRADLDRELPAAEALLRQATRARPDTWSDEHAISALWHGYFDRLLRPCLNGLPEAELARCVADADAAFEDAANYAPFPDVEPTLEALGATGRRLGVISDWGIGLGLVLRHHDLIRHFDFAVISAAVRYAKPDPQLFMTALRRADTIPDYALHIGDAYLLDVLGARAAGITPVLLDRPGHVDPQAMDCLVVRDLYSLLDLLEVPRPGA